jgi:DNA-binding transcriptional LysR family regulator
MPYNQLHKWMRKMGYEKSCVCRMDSVLGFYAGVRARIGLAVLPTYLADSNADLKRVGESISELAVDLWLLTHPDMRHTARVRAVMDFFASSDAML